MDDLNRGIRNLMSNLTNEDQIAGNAGQQQAGRIMDPQRQDRIAGNAGKPKVGRIMDRQRQDRIAGNAGQQQAGRMIDRQRQERIAGNAGQQQAGRMMDRQRQDRIADNAGQQQAGRMMDRQSQDRIANENEQRRRGKNAGSFRRNAAENIENRGGRVQYGINQRRLNQDNPEYIEPQNNNNRKNKPLGFKNLEEISESSSNDIILKIADNRVNFINLLKSCSDKSDVIVLILKIISELSKSNMVNQKLSLILDICNTPVLDAYLMRYLMDLPYAVRKSNAYYWRNPDEFWINFVTTFECLLTLSPSTVTKKYKSLIEAGTKCCLQGLQDKYNYVLNDDCAALLNNLREQLIVKEEEEEKPKRRAINFDENEQPPETFRELNVIPGKEDLHIIDRPYVRANVVSGGYTDIEHYLDVQFRLLREDCFGPLRKGIAQYMESTSKKEYKSRYENIRVYHDVRFVQPYVSKSKVGTVLEINEKDKRRFQKIKWKVSKRLIFGSLLILTKDNFNTCISVTVLDRDEKYLAAGQIPVAVFNLASMGSLYNDDLYTMVESEIYFEPYYNVLKSLQDPSFPETLSMQRYIVNADMTPRTPKYLTENKTYVYSDYEFEVLSRNWPSAAQFHYDNSQYEAYKLALTHEFVVIQGPPGTGKTFIGVQISKTLLNNLDEHSGPLMLVVCYTNHALDQFLEAILEVTPDVVRIGGQSKNEAMEAINLVNLRRDVPQRTLIGNKLLNNVRYEVKLKTNELRILQSGFQAIHEGIVSTWDLLDLNPEVEYITKRYKGDDPVTLWLFSHAQTIYTNTIAKEDDEEDEIEEDFFEEDDLARTNFVLDYLDDIDWPVGQDIELSFSVSQVQSKIKTMQNNRKKIKKFYQQREIDDKLSYYNNQIKMYEEMKKLKSKSYRTITIDERTDVTAIPTPERWKIYFKWARVLENKLQKTIGPLTAEYNKLEKDLEEARILMDLQLIKRTKVIGMTTSGAARLRKLLQNLSIPIVIVEEAAEVLEQHIVASLPKSCQHLILIGDHQQLRPSAACMHLARHYNIEISLFERMIMNDVHSCRLSVQHRMRPEIASLISPHIYKNLENHESVVNFPNVRGTTSDLFFMSHNFMEKDVEDSSSRVNPEEGDLVLGLANYIMQQGYDPEDVTILATYAGQMFYLRQERGKYSHLPKVKITVVDNYQGEESKIILLSLVRNNNNGNIGFLGTDNRICVALSRAKEGLYIFGNMEILKKRSTLWTNISQTLEEKDMIGTRITLQCETHPNEFTTISEPKDFRLVPEGGCLQKCDDELPCHHSCSLICHAYDRKHVNIVCKQKCERILCKLGHVCPLPCAQQCEPCLILVPKDFSCGHTNDICCYRNPNDPTVHCMTVVNVELPHCKHMADKKCYENINEVPCPVPCSLRVSKCGHECQKLCHVKDDPHHEQYQCQKPCARANRGCTAGLLGFRGNHQCRKRCYETCEDCIVEVKKKRSDCSHKVRVKCHEDANAKPCRANCRRTMECGHFCKKKCFAPCGDCKVKVVKKIPECGHEIELACSEPATRSRCTKTCEKKLPCGHKCKADCRSPCDPTKCTEIVAKFYKSPCGHKVQLPCNIHANVGKLVPEDLLQYCTEPCNFFLACDHVCSGTCSGCRQGRIHVACTETCGQLNICSHRCSEPCKKMCPPCKQKCPVKCPHSACGNLCGEPCTPCQEPCSRACRHGACARRCGEACSVAACARPCARALPCGHACRGLCGDPCPPVCKRCDPDNFPKDFLGDDFDEDARFIVLGDCKHILELEDMQNLMTGDQEEITIRLCPFCRAPIINTYRYKEIIDKMIQTEINPIKEKVFGTVAQIQDKKSILNDKIATFSNNYKAILKMAVSNEAIAQPRPRNPLNQGTPYSTNTLESSISRSSGPPPYANIAQTEVVENKTDKTGNTSFVKTVQNDDNNCVVRQAFEKFTEIVRKQKKVSVMELDMQDMYLNILVNVAKVFKEPTKYTREIDVLSNIICTVLMGNVVKISQQLQKDLSIEIKRMHAIVQLDKVTSHLAYVYLKATPKVMDAVKTAEKLIFGWEVFDEPSAYKSLDYLQEVVKVSGIVSREELDLVVSAIGLKKGHWFKCPNGHFYCIGGCGGAMTIGKCNECGAAIGGTNHRLLDSNAHAREIDGSNFAAWSTENNNMGNFML